MRHRLTHLRLFYQMTARRCYEEGQSVAQIARSAHKSTSTIYRRLREAGTKIRSRPVTKNKTKGRSAC